MTKQHPITPPPELVQRLLARFHNGETLEATWAIAFQAGAVLRRWGRPAIEPVPVSERLPGPEDCDAEGRCWGWLNADDGWNLYPVGYLPWWACWLPHWALPVPGVEGTDD